MLLTKIENIFRNIPVVLFVGLQSLFFTPAFSAACIPDPNPPSKRYHTVPTKIIKIYNNTDKTIYPLIETNTNSVDEWLQSYFGLCRSNVFQHVHNYRIYVNALDGVPQGKFVALKVPVFTKLTAGKDPVLGEDKYINWWNGGRVKIYDNLLTYEQDYNKEKDPAHLFSTSITCADIPNNVCQDVSVYEGLGALKDETPMQLTEYTFAGAPLKPGGNGLREWAIQDVDWDVSYVDSVYLPIAMGVMGNPFIGYTGTVMKVENFRDFMSQFLEPGSVGQGWSKYIIPGNKDGAIIKLPGTYNYMLGVLNKTVTPRTKDSPLYNIQRLWKSCFQAGSPSPQYYDFAFLNDVPNVSCTNPMKQDMWKVQEFFLQNFQQYKNDATCNYQKFIQTLKDQNMPLRQVVLARIYGWVPFNDYCKGQSAANALCKTSTDRSDPAIKNPNPNICTKQYHHAHKIYRDLQYSYTGDKYGEVDKQHNFNPYVELIHGKNFLNMDGYAFSIDDAVGNMQEAGTGLIISVGGPMGLENASPFNPKKAITVTLGNPQKGRPTWKKYGACPAAQSDCMASLNIPVGSTSFKLGTIKSFPLKVIITDSANRIYQFVISAGPDATNKFHIPINAVKNGSCKVTDNGQAVQGWCAPFVNKEQHGTPYAHTQLDDNNRPVNYVSTNDPPPR